MFKLIKDEDLNINDIKHVKIYESENYKLRLFNYESGYISIDISKISTNNYIPTLYVRQDDDLKVEDIEISSTGYGALKVNDVKEVVNQYNIAIESVEEIKAILKENSLLKI